MKVIQFKKTFFSVSTFSFFLILFSLNSYNFKYLNFKFFESNFTLSYFNFSFCLDELTLIFLLIVFFVVSLVSLFREFYLEHYNNKKFLYIKLFFFFSIILMSTSGSMPNLITGWDWLGISSLFLIMFYPNKLTLYNSYLTIIFNRLGDGLLILIFCLFLIDVQIFFFFIPQEASLILFFFILCSFTKRAQFPLSSWLPAAISAPTPISAIVHSSTLVTAGLFLISKINFYASNIEISYLFIFFRIIRFLLGGILAKIEMDFKKIVAFSTISQIRIVIFFFFLGLILVGSWHIIIHAFFKTILFCCCGIFFVRNFSDQLFKKIRIKISNKIYWFLFLSIFRIRGLTFCRSYVSKDKILEFFVLTTDYFFIILLIGRIFTLFYCRKILDLFKYNFRILFSSTKKKFMFFSLFRLISWFLGKLILIIFPLLIFPLCQKRELIFILIFLYSIFLLEKIPIKFFHLKYVTLDISLIKRVTFRVWKNFLRNFNKKFYNSENFIFKPYNFSVRTQHSKIHMNEIRIFGFYFLIWIFIINLF